MTQRLDLITTVLGAALVVVAISQLLGIWWAVLLAGLVAVALGVFVIGKAPTDGTD